MKALIKISFRFLLHHPWHSALSILGIALGVAVVLAIDITNESARHGLNLSNNALGAGATHRLYGASGDIDEQIYSELRTRHGVRRIAPVVSGYIGIKGRRFLLLGLDPFANSEIHSHTRAAGGIPAMKLIGSDNAAVILASTADQLSLSVGQSIPMDANGQKLTIAGTIQGLPSVQSDGLRNVILTDIATAQMVLGKIGRLSYIDAIMENAEDLSSVLPKSVNLISNTSLSRGLDQVTRAFHLNLTALSLLGLVIGTFLIYNSMTLSVIQRRELFATLRTMGAIKSELFRVVLLEALFLGFIGLILGIVLGYWLSTTLLHLVTRTINDLYFVTQVRGVELPAVSLIKASLLGLGGTAIAAWMPALESLRVLPSIGQSRSQLEQRTHRLSMLTLVLGVLLWIIAAMVLLFSERSIIAGFAGLFLIIFGFACVVPFLLVQCIRVLEPLSAAVFGVFGKIAARGVRSSLSRTQVAVTALTIAISAIIGVSVMIHSFRTSVSDWLTNSLRADIYVSQARNANVREITPALVTELGGMPGVRALSRGRFRKLQTADGFTRLLILDIDEYAFNNYQFKGSTADYIWDDFQRPDNIIVSEPYAYHHRLSVGDRWPLSTESGERLFTVKGIFTDYGSDQGMVVMHRANYDRHWHDPSVTSLALYLKDGVDADEFFAQLSQDVLKDTHLNAVSNRSLRQRSLEIFDQTFVVTEVLRLISIIIAVIGVLSALMAIHMERAREFNVLRALGTTPRELLKIITTESGIMGLVAGVLACPLGIVTAFLLIFVVNERSFGWSMHMDLTPEPLLTAILLSILSAVIAGLYPARILTRNK